MPRTNLVNAVDDALAVAVVGVDTTITVVDASLLPPAPFYLVVDPFNDTQGREYMLCTLVTVNVLTVTRNLAGSDSDVHDVADIVRITVAAQHIEDIWDSVEAIPPPVPQTFLHDDLTDVGSSQHHARYADSEAIAAVGPHTTTHAALVDVSADQHHTRYTDAEAIAAVGDPGAGVYLPLAGGLMAGAINMGGNNIVGMSVPFNPDDAATKAYVDGVIPPPQTFLHADLTDVGSLPSAHHTRYADSEALAAVAASGLYLPLTADLAAVVTGPLYINRAGTTAIPHITLTGTNPAADTAFLRLQNDYYMGFEGIRGDGTRRWVVESDPSNNVYLSLNDPTGTNPQVVWTVGHGLPFKVSYPMDVTDTRYFNDSGEQSGFMEMVGGAGRQALLWVGGPTRTSTQPWLGVYSETDSGVDAGTIQLRSNNDVWLKIGGAFTEFNRAPARTIQTVAATNPGSGSFANVSFSTSAPAGGISGDVHLVTP